jgi:uncharacterized membrane protein YbhN (UPF0104 family)
VDRLLDLGLILFVAVFAFLYLFGSIGPGLLGGLMIGSFLVLVTGVYSIRSTLAAHAKDVLLLITPSTVEVRMESLVETFNRYVDQLRPGWVAYILGLSILGLLAQVLKVYLFGRSIGLMASYWTVGGIVALMVVTNLIPISVSGLGTRELVFIYFFGTVGVPSDVAVTLSLLVLACIVINGLIASLLFMIDPPVINLKRLLKGD